MLGTVFTASGFCGVAYQVLLGRYLHLIVGSTAHAISALLVAFLIGTSIGAWVGGRWADRTALPLRLYAWAEAGLGLYSLAFPLVYAALLEAYLSVAPPLDQGGATRHALRFAVGVAAFLLPSFLMGLTLPSFARGFPQAPDGHPGWLVRLYALNTLGAAAGAFATAYLLVPLLGIRGTLVGLAALNLAIFAVSYRAAAPVDPARPHEPEEPDAGARPTSVLLALAAASGFFCFSLEVVWTHLLAILLGNSVYAFGLMLGSLLLGLAAGAALARRVPERPSSVQAAAAGALLLAGTVVVLTLGLWDEVPSVFLLLARASPTFTTVELTRLAVALALMTVPATLIGAVFPLVLRLAVAGASRVGGRIGSTVAANTAGSILGALAAPYLLLDHLGSLTSLRGLGAGLLLAGAAASWWLSRWPVRRGVALAALAGAVGATVVPVHWSAERLGSATSVYLGASEAARGRTLYWREDASGGLTSVVQSGSVRTLLTNGKFQGDDGEEMFVQHRLANVPTLLNAQRERALVIGLGTGVTLAALAAHGYKEVVCAEISPAIIDAARRHFAHVNHGVFDSPAVRLLQEDGRSVLLEDPRRYDVVSVEVTTIWFAGVGNIYSDDFYRLVKSRLRQGGVMLQWFPVHHLSARNLFVVVNTLRAVFPHVSVWTYRHQGFVVASERPLAIDLASVRDDLARDTLRPYLHDLDSGSPLELLSDLVVTDGDMDEFLDSLALLQQSDRTVVSTDTWPTLEYETPKDILNHASGFQNRALFRRFRSARPLPFRGQPSASEAALAAASFARGWQDPLGAAIMADALARASLSDVASRWALAELGDRGGRADDAGGWLGQAQAALPALSSLVSYAATSSCVRGEAGFAALGSGALSITRSEGENLEHTWPEAAVDGNASPALGKGWRVRPSGRRVAIELQPAGRAPEVRAVDYAVRSIDAGRLLVRVFARDAGDSWYPIALVAEEDGCTGFRRLQLPRPLTMSTLRLEIEPERVGGRLAIHEIWLEGGR